MPDKVKQRAKLGFVNDFLAKPPVEQIIILVEIIYWLLIFEGALRKWLLPPLAKPLFFVRDPFTLYAYWIAYKNDLIPFRNRWLKFGLLLAVLFFGLGVVQAVREDNSLPTVLYGMRMYFMNLPLAFIAGTLLTGADLKRIAKRTMVVGIGMAALVFVQYRSSPDSLVNKMLDGVDAFQYCGLARASGTFSFTLGHELFTHTLVCFVISSWLLPAKHRPLRGRWLWAATIATLMNVILDGNRGMFACLFVTLIFSLVYRLLCSKQRITIKTFAPEMFCVLGAVIYVTVFANSFEAMKARVTENSTEGQNRIGYVIFATITNALPASHLLGNGIGGGTNGGRALLSPAASRSRAATIYEEGELGRIVSEAGPLGLFFIFYRLGLAAYVVVYGFLASKRSQNPLPLVLCTFTLMSLTIGQITLNGTSNGYCWYFLAFSLAANRFGLKQPAALSSAAFEADRTKMSTKG